MSDISITHFGCTDVKHGHFLKPLTWIPITNGVDGPVYVPYALPNESSVSIPLLDYLNRLIEQRRTLCRIWILYADGSTKCVYWYERHSLLTQQDLYGKTNTTALAP